MAAIETNAENSQNTTKQESKTMKAESMDDSSMNCDNKPIPNRSPEVQNIKPGTPLESQDTSLHTIEQRNEANISESDKISVMIEECNEQIDDACKEKDNNKRSERITDNVRIGNNWDPNNHSQNIKAFTEAWIQSDKSDESSNENDGSTEIKTSDTGMRYLRILYLPTTWTYKQITDYIGEEVGPVVKVMQKDTRTGNHTVVDVEFSTAEQCMKAMTILDEKIIDGIKLQTFSVMSEDDLRKFESRSCSEKSEPPRKKRKRKTLVSSSQDNELWNMDPSGMCGLKPEYLRCLNVSPPITQWVNVTNFRSDKWELKEVMELAGKVLVCKVMHATKKQAKVMYSHPLEAIQAISMLHDQNFYGMSLKITMDHCQHNALIMPNGLTGVGPGLGNFGKPLTDIETHYERYINQKSSGVNKGLFRTPEDILSGKFKTDDFKDAPTSNTENFEAQDSQSANHSSTNDSSNQQETLTNVPNSSVSENVHSKQSQNASVSQNVASPALSTDQIQPSSSPQDIKANQPQHISGIKNIQLNPTESTSDVKNVNTNQVNSGPQNTQSIPNLVPNISGPQNMPSNQFQPAGAPIFNFNQPQNISRPQGFPVMQPQNTAPQGFQYNQPLNVSGPQPMPNQFQFIHVFQNMPRPQNMQMGNQIPRPQNFNFSNPRDIFRFNNTQNVSGPQNAMPFRGPFMPQQNPQSVVQNRPVQGPQYGQNRGQFPVAPGVRPMSGQQRPVTGISPSGPASHPGQAPASTVRWQTVTDGYVCVELTNLPLNTTFSVLSDKLAQCGPVMALQLTAPGCAQVQYAHRAHAERCCLHYNNTNISGKIIRVRII